MRLSAILCFIIAFMLVQTTDAQSHWCGTEHTDAFMARLTKNVKYANTHQLKMNEKRYVPIQFHLVADSNGGGRISEESIYRQLCLINEHYDSIGMKFYISHDFKYLDQESVYNHDVASNGAASAAMVANKTSNAVNVFLVNDVGDAGGYYSPSGDFVAIPNDFFNRPDNVPFDHEIGHLFSLSHPHYGWESVPYTPELYGETVTIMTISSNQSPTVTVEVVDDPNCDTVGDRICDTPPDYGFMQSAGNCTNPWEGTVRDRNEELIYVIPNLVMAYNAYACQDYNFTHGQANAMRADYDQRTNINKSYIPDTTQITEDVMKIAPAAFSTTDYFDSVVCSWDPVPGAHSYFLRVGGDTNFEVYTEDTEFELTDLEPGGTYTWNVIAVNEVGYCTEGTSNIIFFTGTGSTAVDEIDAVSSFAVHPNPVTSQSFNISIQSSKQLDASISLYNLSGQSILGNFSYRLAYGSNLIPVELDNVTPGLYHLYIRTEEGILSEKILIE